MKKALQCIAATLVVCVHAFADDEIRVQGADVVIEAAGSSALSVQLTADTILVTGATPGQPVLFLGITHEEEHYTGVIRREQATVTADASGTASWTRGGGISPRSLWLAIELHAGAVAVAAPKQLSLRRVDPPLGAISSRGAFDALETPFFYAELVLVRPGRGVWTQSASRGGSRDLKLRHGALTIDPRAFRTVSGAETPPGSIHRGDLVIAIDPYSLAFSTVRGEKP